MSRIQYLMEESAIRAGKHYLIERNENGAFAIKVRGSQTATRAADAPVQRERVAREFDLDNPADVAVIRRIDAFRTTNHLEIASCRRDALVLWIRSLTTRYMRMTRLLQQWIVTSKRPAIRLFLSATIALTVCISANAQAVTLDRTAVTSGAGFDGLPDAPSVSLQASKNAGAMNGQQSQAEGTAQVTGVVSDAQGDSISGAEITLTSPGKLGRIRTTVTGSDGTFNFSGLPASKFRIVVAAAGFGTYTSSEFLVKSGESVQVPKIALNVTVTSSVNVFASADQIAEAQVEGQEKQRVFGVFQNFYTSYIWKAEPMSAKQKYHLAFRTILDPTTFVVLAGVAGAEQYNGTYSGYGPGIEGYGKRYGAALADSVSGRIIGSAVLASVFHQDPRYFYQGSGGIRSRTWHALTSAVVARGDNGKLQPSYSHLLGNLAAGGIANAYHPEASRGVGLTFQTLGVTTGANAIGNLFREFLLRDLEPSIPGFANGKKASTSTARHP